MVKINKTNAARLLDKAKIAYELIPYEVDENDLSAVHVAASLGAVSYTHLLRLVSLLYSMRTPIFAHYLNKSNEEEHLSLIHISVKVARIILNAGAMSQFAYHFHIVGHPFLQAFGDVYKRQ